MANNGAVLTTTTADTSASWVIKRKDTGAVVCELFGQSAVAKLNTAKYEAVPILTYLQALNRLSRTAR